MNGGTDLKSLERTEGNLWSLLKKLYPKKNVVSRCIIWMNCFRE